MAIRRKEEDMTENWHLLSQVFSCLDGRSLGRACCTCKAWREVGTQEEVWAQICRAKWPSLDSKSGSVAVEQAGGYRRFFARRFQAQHRYCDGDIKPSLSLEALIFLVDVTAGNEVVCSFARRGHELSGGGDDMFRFTLTLTPGEVVGEGREVKKIEEIGKMKVSWAVMVVGSERIYEVMNSSNPGQIIGSDCTFWETLPDHRCCCPTGTRNHLAEVGIGLGFNHLSLALLDTLHWRYFSLPNALTYFHHLFFQ